MILSHADTIQPTSHGGPRPTTGRPRRHSATELRRGLAVLEAYLEDHAWHPDDRRGVCRAINRFRDCLGLPPMKVDPATGEKIHVHAGAAP